MRKECPSCKQLFDCKHNEINNCHCSQIELSPKIKEFIAKNYSDCLCANCLTILKEKMVETTDTGIQK